MRTVLKWIAVLLVLAGTAAFLAFLYFIPPFTRMPPEAFIKPPADAAPKLNGIPDPVERLLAERGKYIVSTTGCADCHTPAGAQGPDWSRYLAGGVKFVTARGTVVSRNLTPDPETGIGRYTDDDLIRVLRSGIFHDGRAMFYRGMPWAITANWTDEDLHAVIAYLRHLTAVRHAIPPPTAEHTPADPAAAEASYFGGDYGERPH